MFRYFFIVILVFIFVNTASAQQSSVLLSDSIHIKEIKNKIAVLTQDSDSLKHILANMKEELKSSPEKRAVLWQPILDNESKMFEINSTIATLISEKSIIEQEYLLKKVGAKGDDADYVIEMSNLLDNKFMQDQLADTEIKQIKQGESIDMLSTSSITSLDSIYSELLRMKTALNEPGLDATHADSIKNIYEALQKKSFNIREEFKKSWKPVFDTKVYVYSRVLDKIGVNPSDIQRLSDRARDIRAEFSNVYNSQFAPEIYIYPKEKEMVLLFEKLLSEKLAYQMAIDSISKEMNMINKFEFDRKYITQDSNKYVNFSKVIITSKNVVRDSIENVTLPTNGEIYMICAATLTKPLSTSSSLRKVTPIGKFVNEKGLTEYYVGVYRTKQEAIDDSKRLSSLGLNANVTQWKDGGKVKNDGTIYPVDANDYFYSLEFNSVDNELETVISELAPSKQIVKFGDKFQLGVFEKYVEVVEIQKKLPVNSSIIKIKKQ